jgi:hypothetical protein
MNSENDRYWQELAEVDEREMVAMRQYSADLQADKKASITASFLSRRLVKASHVDQG